MKTAHQLLLAQIRKFATTNSLKELKKTLLDNKHILSEGDSIEDLELELDKVVKKCEPVVFKIFSDNLPEEFLSITTSKLREKHKAYLSTNNAKDTHSNLDLFIQEVANLSKEGGNSLKKLDKLLSQNIHFFSNDSLSELLEAELDRLVKNSSLNVLKIFAERLPAGFLPITMKQEISKHTDKLRKRLCKKHGVEGGIDETPAEGVHYFKSDKESFQINGKTSAATQTEHIVAVPVPNKGAWFDESDEELSPIGPMEFTPGSPSITHHVKPSDATNSFFASPVPAPAEDIPLHYSDEDEEALGITISASGMVSTSTQTPESDDLVPLPLTPIASKSSTAITTRLSHSGKSALTSPTVVRDEGRKETFLSTVHRGSPVSEIPSYSTPSTRILALYSRSPSPATSEGYTTRTSSPTHEPTSAHAAGFPTTMSYSDDGYETQFYSVKSTISSQSNVGSTINSEEDDADSASTHSTVYHNHILLTSSSSSVSVDDDLQNLEDKIKTVDREINKQIYDILSAVQNFYVNPGLPPHLLNLYIPHPIESDLAPSRSASPAASLTTHPSALLETPRTSSTTPHATGDDSSIPPLSPIETDSTATLNPRSSLHSHSTEDIEHPMYQEMQDANNLLEWARKAPDKIQGKIKDDAVDMPSLREKSDEALSPLVVPVDISSTSSPRTPLAVKMGVSSPAPNRRTAPTRAQSLPVYPRSISPARQALDTVVSVAKGLKRQGFGSFIPKTTMYADSSDAALLERETCSRAKIDEQYNEDLAKIVRLLITSAESQVEISSQSRKLAQEHNTIARLMQTLDDVRSAMQERDSGVESSIREIIARTDQRLKDDRMKYEHQIGTLTHYLKHVVEMYNSREASFSYAIQTENSRIYSIKSHIVNSLSSLRESIGKRNQLREQIQAYQAQDLHSYYQIELDKIVARERANAELIIEENTERFEDRIKDAHTEMDKLLSSLVECSNALLAQISSHTEEREMLYQEIGRINAEKTQLRASLMRWSSNHEALGEELEDANKKHQAEIEQLKTEHSTQIEALLRISQGATSIEEPEFIVRLEADSRARIENFRTEIETLTRGYNQLYGKILESSKSHKRLGYNSDSTKEAGRLVLYDHSGKEQFDPSSISTINNLFAIRSTMEHYGAIKYVATEIILPSKVTQALESFNPVNHFGHGASNLAWFGGHLLINLKIADVYGGGRALALQHTVLYGVSYGVFQLAQPKPTHYNHEEGFLSQCAGSIALAGVWGAASYSFFGPAWMAVGAGINMGVAGLECYVSNSYEKESTVLPYIASAAVLGLSIHSGGINTLSSVLTTTTKVAFAHRITKDLIMYSDIVDSADETLLYAKEFVAGAVSNLIVGEDVSDVAS